MLNGCGSGGYPGGGVDKITANVNSFEDGIQIDATQSVTLTAVGQTGNLTWGETGCPLPACGTLVSTGANTALFTAPTTVISAFSFNIIVGATGSTSTKTIAVTVSPAPALMGTPAAGFEGQAYTTTLVPTGGTAPTKLGTTVSGLPAGLSYDPTTGIISGTPTVSGTFNVSLQLSDNSDVQQAWPVIATILIRNPITMQLAVSGTPGPGVVGTAYSATLHATSGTAPYTFSVLSGSLPPGLTLSAAGIITGTPTAAGTYTFVAQAQDATGRTGYNTFVITVTNPSLAITTGSLPNGTVGVGYASTIGVTGGVGPYSCSIVTGALPAGLSLGAGCAVSGTPTVAGTVTLTIRATDSSNPTLTATGVISIQILPAPLTILTGNLPNGTVGTNYSAAISISGGTAPYSCSIASGILPAGLVLNANCTVTGLPLVAETEVPLIRVVDSSNPANTVTRPISITINQAAVTMSVSGTLVATANVPFVGAVLVTGGTLPYTCVLASGTLPAGLTLNANCTVTGTPTTSGTYKVTVSATDSSNPQNTATGTVTITVNPALVLLIISSPSPATVGSPYTGNVPVTGGTAPYSCLLAGGTLPAGLTLNANCTITGTPTAAGITPISVKVTDSGNPSTSATGPVVITVQPASVTLTLSSPPPAVVDELYVGTIGVSGGTAPYNCIITSGTLPAGLVLGPLCTITGIPLTTGTTTITVQATDSGVPVATITGPVTITVNPAGLVLTQPSTTATVSVAYTGNILVSGGTAPYTCVLSSGTLPTGLSLGSNCAITGTPTVTGAFTFNVKATDSGNPQASGSGSFTITVGNVPTLTFTGSLPNAIVGVAYTQTLTANGGVGPFTYAVTTGNLPAGLTLATDGTISGTPTAPGAKSFTVTATDSEGTPQTVSLPLVLLVVYPTTPQDALLNGPYAFLFQGYDDVLAGVLAYQTATVGSFTADGTGLLNSGEMDSNHQTSNPTGTTVSTNGFLGTYTIGTDARGSLTITALNADGTTGTTSTYAISVKLPHPPATHTFSGSMIEFDNNNLQGTKGTGTFLAQTVSTFTAGLSGSYAFGVQGDTPCLPSCTLGISAGPAAAVGQFSADGNGNINTGTGDETIGSTTYASSALSGTYGAADGNGRMQMSMTTLNMPVGVYPADYAVYMVDANHAFMMSTDKHSAYILLAGSATLQQGTFNNASMTGPYIGYENAQTNPGLVGAALQNVLNLSTASIFRGTGNGTGTCTTTNVDTGGTSALVSGLTGLGSGSNVLNALLGTYQSTGNSTCTVAASGRGVLNYPVPSTLLSGVLALLGLPVTAPPARVVYLYGPDQGYFLETGYAGLGQLQQQTGAPFSLGTLNGTYVYQTSPASSVASTDTSGVFTADGAGAATTTYDLNVGVGTVNLLQLGVPGNSNYTLTDATAGRYLLGTSTVVYAISSGSFVLLDTNALITSPSVALLY